MNSLGNRVELKRRELGFSQLQLAQRLGQTQQSIQHVEAGRVKTPRYLAELAKTLKVSSDFLLYGTVDKGENLKGFSLVNDAFMSWLMENGEIIARKNNVHLRPEAIWNIYSNLYKDSYKPDMTKEERQERLEALAKLIKYASL